MFGVAAIGVIYAAILRNGIGKHRWTSRDFSEDLNSFYLLFVVLSATHLGG